jgi:hypothetical protein
VIELSGNVCDHFDAYGLVERLYGHHRASPLGRSTRTKRAVVYPSPHVKEWWVRDEDWQGLDDEGLGRLLVERWLYRGLMLAVMFGAAILTTWIGARGLAGRTDQLTVAVLLALALAAAIVAFTMRQQDLRIHRELRRRRAAGR